MTAEEELEVAEGLFKLGYYAQCLFFCHLSLEKMLKALVMKRTKQFPPLTHDLRRLAQIAKLELSKKQELVLEKIFAFNIAGRYNEEKLKFHKKCNKNYALQYLNISKDLIIWFKKEFQKK